MLTFLNQSHDESVLKVMFFYLFLGMIVNDREKTQSVGTTEDLVSILLVMPLGFRDDSIMMICNTHSFAPLVKN